MTEGTPDRQRRPAAVRAGAGLAQNKRPGRAGRANKRLTGSLGDGLFRHRQRGTKGQAGKAPAEGKRDCRNRLAFRLFSLVSFLPPCDIRGFVKQKPDLAGGARGDRRRYFPFSPANRSKNLFFQSGILTNAHKIGKISCHQGTKEGGPSASRQANRFFCENSLQFIGITDGHIMKNPTKTVKSCKNCTISEVWVQITGMPRELDLTHPYPLFHNLQKHLRKDGRNLQCGISRNSPVLFNIQSGKHNVSICPPFWNGEIKWEENNYKKIIRTGHQFFALHSIFSKQSSYVDYESSFATTLKKILGCIENENSFKAVQVIVRYINTIEVPKSADGKFNIGSYLNTNFSYHLNNPVLASHFNYDLQSSYKQNRVIGVNTVIRGHKNNSVISSVQTTGVASLEKQIELNDAAIYEEIKSIKEELKEVFFDVMTDKTKTEIMEVQYA